MNIKNLNTVKTLLSQALQTAIESMPKDRAVAEARGHMRLAMQRLEQVSHQQAKKSDQRQTEREKWWGHITAGAINSPTSSTAESNVKALAELNKLIEDEKKNLANLETDVGQKTQVLQD